MDTWPLDDPARTRAVQGALGRVRQMPAHWGGEHANRVSECAVAGAAQADGVAGRRRGLECGRGVLQGDATTSATLTSAVNTARTAPNICSTAIGLPGDTQE